MDMNLLLTLTQAFFMLGFVAMAAGTFYFFMERGDLKPEHRATATYAGVITFVAAIMYYVMKDIVLFPGGSIGQAEIDATMPIRYVDWLITTPLLLVEFGLIAALAGAGKGILTKLIVADIIMIATGFLGEVGAPGSVNNYVFFIISTLAWIYIVLQVRSVDASKGSPAVQKAIGQMKWFVIAGWAIYPIGTATQEFFELTNPGGDFAAGAAIAAMIYVVADVLNKVGFGMIAVRAAKSA